MMFSQLFVVGLLTALASAQSTCTPTSAPSGACPTAYDACCAFICAEAQVPFQVCQQTDGSGQFATCTACPSSPVTSGTTTTTQTVTNGGGTGPSTSTTTLTSTTTTCTGGGITAGYTTYLPQPTYVSGASETYVAWSGAVAIGILCAMVGL